ncbi:MAG: AMP-binding protein [Acetobacteraceae bacterium]|nr:AMP-binding protein [Acetobacteraceae bacterium]
MRFPSVAAAFAASAERGPDRVFLHVLPETASAYGIAAGDITYGAAAETIGRLRRAYAEAGYGRGHRVGLMLENRPAFFLHWFALNGLGVSVVPLSTALRSAELDYLVRHSEIALAVVARGHRPDVACPAMAEDAPPPPAARRLDPWPTPDEATECGLLYTSGTTGRPKGCVLSNGYFLRTGEWYNGIGGLCALRPDDRLLTPLPLNHVNAMAFSAMAMILVGGCLIQLDRFHPRTWWESVCASGATIIHYLGVMPSMLMSAAPHPRERDHRLRFGFGAGIDRRLHAAAEARFGFPWVELWAMTETGGGAAVGATRPPRHVGEGCIGRAEPLMEALVLDDSGTPCPPGVPGEFLVRAAGPDRRAGFFTEYLKDEAATAQAWAGGWFHTGDVVRADAEGYFYFVERKKNLIRRSGENIAAAEVESVLRRHELVADVAVAATPDAVREEEVLACVVPHTTIQPARMAEAAEAIVRAALEELSYFKVPGWVAFLDALPLTASQKVARGELKELARRLPGTEGCVDTRALKRRGG